MAPVTPPRWRERQEGKGAKNK
uniref:Uncharacterized protein n=1 Tax=Anguilla anguilla TaxID=7936 RepID=A0A0E9QXN7_ANGAN